MNHRVKSIRSFIGAKDFETSRTFYRELGFEEIPAGENMYFFRINGLGFYLQDYYVKDWVDNSMLFLEVGDVVRYHREVEALGLHQKYEHVKLSAIVDNDWGSEFFLHDPSGVLWHIGQFKS